jgi:hypothetical protein
LNHLSSCRTCRSRRSCLHLRRKCGRGQMTRRCARTRTRTRATQRADRQTDGQVSQAYLCAPVRLSASVVTESVVSSPVGDLSPDPFCCVCLCRSQSVRPSGRVPSCLPFRRVSSCIFVCQSVCPLLAACSARAPSFLLPSCCRLSLPVGLSIHPSISSVRPSVRPFVSQSVSQSVS